jgi:hypothetical protein
LSVLRQAKRNKKKFQPNHMSVHGSNGVDNDPIITTNILRQSKEKQRDGKTTWASVNTQVNRHVLETMFPCNPQINCSLHAKA